MYFITFPKLSICRFTVCEEVCGQGPVFEEDSFSLCTLKDDELKEWTTNPDKLHELEGRVKGWIKRLAEILKESEQIRRENDSSGESTSSHLIDFKKREIIIKLCNIQMN